MNTYQQLLIFRTCLAVLVVLKRMVRVNEQMPIKTAKNLEPLIEKVNDEVNRLYRVNDE